MRTETVPVPGPECLEDRKTPSLMTGGFWQELSTVMEMALSPATLAWTRTKGEAPGSSMQASMAFSKRLPKRM